MLSLLARPVFLVTSPKGYTVVSHVFPFLPEEMVAIFFRNNSYSLYMKLSRVRLGSFEGYGKGVSSNHFKAFMGMYRYYLEKYILDHVLQIFVFFWGGEGWITVISLFNEGRKVECISSRYSSLQLVIICIKVREI